MGSIAFDDEYVTYVWFDALLNYITALGYHPDPESAGPLFIRFGRPLFSAQKNILTTHSVYWGTMLFALGLEPAKHLCAWLVDREGQK